VSLAIQDFLKTAQTPMLLEPGEDPFPITPENFALSPRGSAVTLECWTQTRNLVRRVRRIASQRRGRLELEAERFGGRTGTLLLLDSAHSSNDATSRHGARVEYRERFRRSLHRQFPDWKLVELSTEPDLQHSLSPSYARAYLRKGATGFAALGASENCLDPDGALSFGLIWLDYLRRRETKTAIEGLAMFLPAGAEAITCHRIRHLDSEAARFAVFAQTPGGHEAPVDPQDYTNLATTLEPFRVPLSSCGAEVTGWVARIAQMEGVEQRPRPDGSVSLAVRGIEFARTSGDSLLFGLEGRHAAGGERHLYEIEQIVLGLARWRRAGEDRNHPMYAAQPEAWIESQIRGSLDALDANLLTSPVYTQAPHRAGGQRGVVDLLAIDRAGRLAVVEIKASQDIHLPLQALDYWMRVKWHLDRGEFASQGYFPGVALSSEPPHMLLVSPALDFHPSNEALLRFFSPEVRAERLGIGLQWRQELQVMFRAPSRVWPSYSSNRSGRHSTT